MLRSRHVPAAAFAAVAITVLAAGCSDPEPATPRVTFESTISPGSNPPEGCPETGTWFSIGSFGAPPFDQVKPVDDGGKDPESGGSVAVTCSVTPATGGFNVRATARLTGAAGGNFTVEGFFTEQGEQANIFASFTKVGQSGAYVQKDCVVRYTTQFQGVAAGRVWGEITCPTATAETAQRTCQALGQFRFENCAQ